MAVLVAVVQLQEDTLLSEATNPVTSSAKRTALLWRVSSLLLAFFGLKGQKRLCVGDTKRVAQVVVVGDGVAVGLVGRVFVRVSLLLLIQVYACDVGILVVAVTKTEPEVECHVAPFSSESAEELQLRIDVLVGAVA